MNREIKFRAWEEKCNFMNDQVRIIVNPFGCGETYYQVTDSTNWIDVPRHHVMQWTGLKGYMNDSFNDYEEKDVYQGDHITITYDACYGGFYTEETYSGVVDLDDTGTAFILRNADYERQGEEIPNRIGDMEISFNFPDDDDLEQIYLHAFELVPDNIVINGNIYENPELLKEE